MDLEVGTTRAGRRREGPCQPVGLPAARGEEFEEEVAFPPVRGPRGHREARVAILAAPAHAGVAVARGVSAQRQGHVVRGRLEKQVEHGGGSGSSRRPGAGIDLLEEGRDELAPSLDLLDVSPQGIEERRMRGRERIPEEARLAAQALEVPGPLELRPTKDRGSAEPRDAREAEEEGEPAARGRAARGLGVDHGSMIAPGAEVACRSRAPSRSRPRARKLRTAPEKSGGGGGGGAGAG